MADGLFLLIKLFVNLRVHIPVLPLAPPTRATPLLGLLNNGVTTRGHKGTLFRYRLSICEIRAGTDETILYRVR